MDSIDILKNWKFGEEVSEEKFDFGKLDLNYLIEKYRLPTFPKQLNTRTTIAPPSHDDSATNRSPSHDSATTRSPSDDVSATTKSPSSDVSATTRSPSHDSAITRSTSHDDSAITRSASHDSATTKWPSHDVLTTTRSPSQYGGPEDDLFFNKFLKQATFVPPTTTDNYYAAVKRFWESSDYKEISEYIRSLEESLKSNNGLDRSRLEHYSPYYPPHRAQLTPPPPTHREHYPAPATHNWEHHRDTPVVRHKHGLQTWHIVIMVVILVAAMISYACKISSKRISTPRRRRGTASSTAQEREPAAATAPARDDLYAVVSVSRSAAASRAQAQPLTTNRRVDLQEVNVESIGFVVPEAALPPSRPDTPPPPYPGPPLLTRPEHQKPSDPPPPYHAAVKTTT